MSATLSSSDLMECTLICGSEGFSDLYLPEPLDLDYDEPNAVVEEYEVEFVAPENDVRAVSIPVVMPQAAPVRSEPAIQIPIEGAIPSRTAA